MEKSVTVIITNYNKSPYLPACIESVRAQSYRNLRVIVVDDCSTDGSRSLIEQYAMEPGNLGYLFHAVNEGVSVSRNDGAFCAKTDYITFLDADDYYASPDKIANEVAAIERTQGRKKPMVSFSSILFVDSGGFVLQKVKPFRRMRGRLYRALLLSGKKSGAVIRDYVMSYELFSRTGGYRPGMSLFEDFDLLVRLCPYCDFVHSGGTGTAYRQISGGLSDQSQHKLYQTKRDICLEHLKKCGALLRGAGLLFWRIAEKLRKK